MSDECSRVHINVTGRVQGVFYRISTQKIATLYTLKGYVKNNPDRSVEIVAEGKEHMLQKLVEWSYNGSDMCNVDNVDVSWHEPTKQFQSFEIRY